MPRLDTVSSYRTWANVLQAGFSAHQAAVERGAKAVIDAYGATNPAEFFAVATECFFEKSLQLQRKHPDLYAVLEAYYGQDPARLAASNRDSAT